MKTRNLLAIALLATAPLFTAQAAGRDTGIGSEIRQEMANAREEMRIELAKARQELDTGNLRLDDGFQFTAHDGKKSKRAKAELAPAEITPQGDLLIDGKVQAINDGQRRQLLAYRGQVITVAKAGIDIGQRSADAALEAVGDGSWVGLLVGAMT
ncbi:MAG TPA: hypothetical protein PK861_04100, partial [Thermomonas sp.]|nr:hypothetical protein [Thermomonas sp.]